MREQPDLEQLKRQAKELLRGFASGDTNAFADVNAYYMSANPTEFALHHAQLVVARSYGFESWPKLKAFVDGVTVKRLADAVNAGNLAQVRKMLRTRPELADMAISYGDERRPIHFAVMKRLPEMARLLMQNGADARAGVCPHRDATTAWTIAKERGYEEIVAILEEEEQNRQQAPNQSSADPIGDETARAAVASADVEWLRARRSEGTLVNPIRWEEGGLLTVAVRNNRKEVLQLLLAYGFDPDERISSGEGDWVAYSQGYPLWYCAALGKQEMAEILLQHGANPNVHVDSSGSAVYSAYSHKQWEMVDLLRRHGGVVTADIAAIYRETELARQMLADVSSGHPVVEELLRFGASGGDPEIVRMALALTQWPRDDSRWFGILTEPLYFWHFIPWLYAGNRDFDRGTYLPCFRLILNRCGANVAGSFGRTALHEVAAMRDHVSDEETAAFTKVLLDAGARVDGRDDILKSTPLGWACRWGRETVARVMLERGAPPVETDAEPWAQPLAWAEKMGRRGVVRLLLEHVR
jgi:ankyrin repeat protein